MFNLKPESMATPKTIDSPSVNIIGSGTTIEGDIKSDGDIRVDGILNGSLTTKGKLVLGSTGNIQGEISCQNADISGTINGKIKVHDLLSLKTTSKLTCDIVTNKLSIEPGANFSGLCTMASAVPNIKISNNAESATKQEKAASV